MKTRKSLYDDGFAQFENEESNPRKPTIRIQEKKFGWKMEATVTSEH